MSDGTCLNLRYPVAACIVALATLAAASPVRATEIRAVGVLGNSGQSGRSLVRVAAGPPGRGATGVAPMADGTIWLSAGNALNRLALSGELLEQRAIEPNGSVVDSTTFAVLGRAVYFLGRAPDKRPALFALSLGDKKPAAALPIALPARKDAGRGLVLASQPLDGKLLLVGDSPQGGGVDVHFLDPAAGRCEKAFSLKAGTVHGAAVDASRRIIYIGADAIHAVRPDGSPASVGFPIACMKTPAIPTAFRGTISLAGGAIWDSAWYGFLSRHGTDGRNAPGRVVEWHHELGFPKQIADLGGANPALTPLLITTATPAALYYAHWDERAMRLVFVRRLGCLPEVYSVGLSTDGWVACGTATCQLWWRWEDGADAIPRAAKLHIATTAPFFRGEQCLAVGAQYAIDGKNPRKLTVFTPDVGDRNESQRFEELALPCEAPAGLAARPGSEGRPTDLFVTDPGRNAIWRCGLSLGNLRPDGKWQQVAVEGLELSAPTDLVALTDGRLLLADGGRVLRLAPAPGGGYRVEWQLAGWGEGPASRFGPRLRLAADGPWMLISDTDRHRVVWLDWTQEKPTPLGILGRADQPGDDLRHLRRPGHVALRGNRAILADTGNQRILKLVLEP